MPKGRIPKPKAINDLRGDTHKRRRHKAEPEPPKGNPQYPDHLDEIARQEWKSVTEQLEKMGLLSSADATALELYFSAYSCYRHAESMVRNNWTFRARIGSGYLSKAIRNAPSP